MRLATVRPPAPAHVTGEEQVAVAMVAVRLALEEQVAVTIMVSTAVSLALDAVVVSRLSTAVPLLWARALALVFTKHGPLHDGARRYATGAGRAAAKHAARYPGAASTGHPAGAGAEDAGGDDQPGRCCRHARATSGKQCLNWSGPMRLIGESRGTHPAASSA